jgi:N6-adenosine-specific RNA methylase IME4
MSERAFHRYANVFPLLEGAEFDGLVADIKAHGVHEPIWIFEEQILDGRNRRRAARVAGVECPERIYTGDDPLGFVVSVNLHRRHLDTSQRGMAAARLATLRLGDNQHSEGPSIEGASKLLNVGRATTERAREVLDHGVSELQSAVDHGKIAVSTAAEIANAPVDEQRRLVALSEKEILLAAKTIAQDRAVIKRAENQQKRHSAPPLPHGKFETIVIDPPWPITKMALYARPDVAGELDYPAMSEEEIFSFPLPEFAADNCHLFCWSTQKFLPSALRLVEHWSFKYLFLMTWHKSGGFQPLGLPAFNSEFVIYARKGTPKFIDTKNFGTSFEGRRRQHSRKPDEFYSLVARVTARPRIDVFSREQREGFVSWGNETDKFTEASSAITGAAMREAAQ